MSPLDNSRRSFLKTCLAFTGTIPLMDGLLLAQSGGSAGPLVAYVGTFSSPLRDMLPTQVDLPPGNGRGIHLFQVSRTTGAMTPFGVYEMSTSPSCLALNASGTRLYSANETDRVGDNKQGSVSAFVINRPDGRIELLNIVPSGGAGPAYVSVHPSGRFLLAANYFGGSVAVLPIRPDGRCVYAGNRLHDSIGIFSIGPNGELTFVGEEWTRGSYPRSFNFEPTGQFLYCCNQLGDNIAVFRVNRGTGGLNFTGHYAPVGNPSIIVFLDLAAPA